MVQSLTSYMCCSFIHFILKQYFGSEAHFDTSEGCAMPELHLRGGDEIVRRGLVKLEIVVIFCWFDWMKLREDC